MEIRQQLDRLLALLNSERDQASSQGFNTITLTHEEVSMITNALNQANQQISQPGS